MEKEKILRELISSNHRICSYLRLDIKQEKNDRDKYGHFDAILRDKLIHNLLSELRKHAPIINSQTFKNENEYMTELFVFDRHSLKLLIDRFCDNDNKNK